MAAPRGLRRDDVIDAADALLVARGSVERVTLADVAASLGVRAPSLYAHVANLDDLRRALAVRAMPEVTAALVAAARGRRARAAVRAVLRAHVEYAVAEPGRYSATLLPVGDDPELRALAEAATKPLDDVLVAYGFDRTERVHWYRVAFAAVHGFAVLRRRGVLSYDVDPDDTLELMTRSLAEQIHAAAPTPRRRRAGEDQPGGVNR